MYKHCTTEESAQRQRQLEGCLMKLMHTIPYSQITIGHICDLAGVSRKSFYRYFASKDGCLCALLDHCIIDGASFYLPDQTKHQNILDVYERFFSYWQRMSPLLDVLQWNNFTILLVERMVRYITEEEQDFHRYLGVDFTDSHEQMLFVVSGIMGLVINWHRRGFQKPASQMAAIMYRVIH